MESWADLIANDPMQGHRRYAMKGQHEQPGRPPDAWPALLALTQASRDLMALAIGGHARESAMQQAQAFANRDAAAALLLAMQAFGDPSGHAMQPDELHCCYTDAHDAAAVASQAADALKLLTPNASTVPATAGVAPANAAAASLIHATPLPDHTVAVEPALARSAAGFCC